MEFRYPLPLALIEQASSLKEFANGGAQCHVQLVGGAIFPGLLISDAKAIIAMRGYSELPFEVARIERLFQTNDDLSPNQRDGWQFFDSWRTSPC